MKTTKEAKRQAKQLFRFCLLDGRLDEGRVRLAVTRVMERKRRGYLVLLALFQRLVRLDRERHTAEVQSAAPLPADLWASVRASLETVYGPGLNIIFAQRSALIGGMRVKVGSDVYDGSVQSGLARLERSF
jgi:F-type H+-transporting ATPase subunit delta